MSTKLYPSFVSGNICQFTLPTGTTYTELIFPCSFKKLKLMQNNLQIYLWRNNEERISTAPTFCINNDISFPVVNGKSPCTLNLVRNNAGSTQDVTFVIEEIGGVGDVHYWDYGLDYLSGIINPNMKAKISVQPTDTSAREGENFSFSVVATGAVSGYQWETYIANKWQNIDATSSTYTDLMVQPLDDQKYRCAVISIYGEVVYSDEVTLTLDTTPAPENSSKSDTEEKEMTIEPIEKKEEKEVIDDEREVEE